MFPAQLVDRVCDHLYDIDVLSAGAAGAVRRLLQRHVREMKFVMVPIAIRVGFLFIGRRPAAKRHVASLRTVGENRDLTEGSSLDRTAVALFQQFAHALLRHGIMLEQDEVGDRADDAMSGEVPCRSGHRNRCAHGKAGRSNCAPHGPRAPFGRRVYAVGAIVSEKSVLRRSVQKARDAGCRLRGDCEGRNVKCGCSPQPRGSRRWLESEGVQDQGARE
jgi:hypothetical protein